MEQLAALRAEWFAQLSEAIDSAQRVAWQLGTREQSSPEVRELYGRLEAARVELDSLRGLNRAEAPGVEMEWLRKLGWTGEELLEP